MLQLVSEQYDSYMDGMEYGLFRPERIAQLEREDLDRYHRSILKASSYCDPMDGGRCSKADEDTYMDQETINEHLLQFRDETKSEMDEMKAQLSVIISLLRDSYNDEEAKPIEEFPVCNSSSKTTAEADDVLKVNEVDDSQEMPDLEDETGCESTTKDSMIEYDSHLIPILDSKEIVSCVNTVKPIINEENKQGVEISCVVLGKMADPTNACKVLDEMSEPFFVEYLLDTNVTKDAHYLIDKRLTLSPVNSDEGLNGNKYSLSLYPYIIETSSCVNGSSCISGLITNIPKVNVQYLSYMDDVLGVSETNSPSLQKLDFTPTKSLQKLGFNLQVFDPGTLSLIIVYAQPMSIFVDSTTDLHKAWVKDVTLRMDVNLGTNVMVNEGLKIMLDGLKGVDSLPMLTFDPGIGYWHLTCCVPLMSSVMPNSGWQWPQVNYYRKDVIAYSYTGAFVLTLSGKGHGASVNGMKGVDSSLRHVQSVVAFRDCFGSWIGLSFTPRADFAWDPGICVIFAYIIEDKDDFKRVGNRILAMLMISNIRDGHMKVNMKKERNMLQDLILDVVMSEFLVDGVKRREIHHSLPMTLFQPRTTRLDHHTLKLLKYWTCQIVVFRPLCSTLMITLQILGFYPS